MGFTGSCIVTHKFAGESDGGIIPGSKAGQRQLWMMRFAIHRKTRTIHVVSQCSLDLSAAFPVAEAHD
jgi:hypothetical protein